MKRFLIQWLTQKERMQKHPFLRRLFWRRDVASRRMAQIATRMRQKKVITVVFMAMDLPCWKCDSVFRLMLAHPRFNPIIWIVPELQISDEDERNRNLLLMRSYFETQNFPFIETTSLEELREKCSPDIIFLAKPYWGTMSFDINSLSKELICYVPYCYHNTEKGGFQHYAEEYTWRNFFPSRGVLRQSRQHMNNGGANVVVTGLPIADAYLFPEPGVSLPPAWRDTGERKLRVIWAPHWSISGDSWFKSASFLELAEAMLVMAEKYADRVQWAFKPHPLLRDTLYQHPEWGRERTDAYYERWATMPNTQLEVGDYEALFKQSDAMIHDSGSFIIEYLLVDKPCMYVQNDNYSKIDFNEDTREALSCYHKGNTIQDIEEFLQWLIQGGHDSMKPARHRYRKNYLKSPHGVSAAQNIVNSILKGR